MPSDTRTPDEIERDIEHERAELASTVDALQEKLSPEAIIREITRGFRDHGGEFGTAISRSVKQNPVALAVTGVGLAWLMFGRSYEEPNGLSRDYRTVSGRNGRWSGGAVADHDVYGGTTRDPLPLRDSQRADYRAGWESYSRDRYAGYPEWARDDLDEDWDEDEDRSFGDRARDAAASAGHTAQDSASRAASGVRSASERAGASAHAAGSSVASGASGAAARVASGARSAGAGVGNAARSAADRAGRARRRLARGTEDLSESARERIVAARARAVDMARRADSSARRGYARGRDATQYFVEEQPLVAGALALTVGAALAGALPRTRQEDELLGDTRDDLFDEAERVFHDERQKAERVARAALQEAGTIAREKRDEADASAPGDKSAIEAAADEARQAGERVTTAAKQEAEREELGKPKV